MREQVIIKFGQKLKALRKSKGLSQSDLADISDFNRNYIGMVERGERNPTLKTISRLAEALKIDISDFFV